jgi:hypothetical protein
MENIRTGEHTTEIGALIIKSVNNGLHRSALRQLCGGTLAGEMTFRARIVRGAPCRSAKISWVSFTTEGKLENA